MKTNICPKCKKGEIMQEINYLGYIFKRKKKITFYCPLCDFKNTKIFDIKESEYQIELEKKENNI